jgi:general secretion pathway protein K
MMRASERENGAALLSAILIVALMSVAALAMVDGIGGAITQAKTADARVKLTWQMAGVEEAGFIGVEQLRQDGAAALNANTPGFRQTFETDVSDAVISTILDDASNCFNLNALRVLDDSDDEQSGASALYTVLLVSAGFDESEAEGLTAKLMDWLDPDNSARPGGAEDNFYATLRTPYRASGVPLASVSELRAIRGYSKQIVEAISPLVCVRNTVEIGVFNINTILPDQAALLSMALGGNLDLADAENLLLLRPPQGWASVDALFEEGPIERISPDVRRADLLGTVSNYVELHGRVDDFGQSGRFSIVYKLVANQQPKIVRRSYGAAP